MSKKSEARVRDELLQALYTATLRCTLAAAQHGFARRVQVSTGIAAGVLNILETRDLLLLPKHGAAAFRILRGVAAEPGPLSPVSDPAAGVLVLPADEAAAVAYTLGAAQALRYAHAGTPSGALVCAVLPPAIALDPPLPRLRAGAGPATMPATWTEAGGYAARFHLPLLLVTDHARSVRKAADRDAHLAPAPRYPSMPVDREDPLAVYRVAFESAARAREGSGPSHIAGVPFRLQGSLVDQPDALARLEAALRKRGVFQKAWRRQLEHRLVRELTGDGAG